MRLMPNGVNGIEQFVSAKLLGLEESINDSVSVDLGICNTGVIGNNDLVVAVQRSVLSKTMDVRVTEKVGVCQKRSSGGAGGQVATPRHDSEYAGCCFLSEP